MTQPRTTNRIMRVLVIPALAAFSVLAAPAHAANNEGVYSDSFVDGGGSLTDDWGEHYDELGGSLCWGCGNSQNRDLVLMWQAVLFADGYFYSTSDIDGDFGPVTRDATRAWEYDHGTTVNGAVGRSD